MPRDDDVTDFGDISPVALRAYALHLGLERTSRAINGASVWIDREQNLAVLLPERPDFDDYLLNCMSAVQGLADLSGKDAATIKDILLNAENDVLRFRAKEETPRDASIPLGDGLNFFTGIRKALTASAKAHYEKRAYFGQAASSAARQFMSSARLGQTEAGSYVVTVIANLPSPVVEGDTSSLALPATPTLQRRIMESAIRGFNAAEVAARSYTTSNDAAVFLDAVSDGVSADLCDAIVEMSRGAGRYGVGIDVDWSLYLTETDAEIPTSVSFDSGEIPALLAGAEALRSAVPEETVTIVGWIETLSRPAELSGPGTITLVVDSGLSKGAKVRVALDAASYAQAVAAHYALDRVTVQGLLTRMGNRNWIHDGRILGLSASPAPPPRLL